MWFLISRAAQLAAWAVGHGMGYRRGVTDALNNDILGLNYRFNGE
jgi:hypothetical protein